MRLNILFIVSIFSVQFGWSQNSDTLFLDHEWKPTKYLALAKYFRIHEYNKKDSSLYVRDHFISNGKLQMTGTYHGFEMLPDQRFGLFKYYHENGNVKAEYEFTAGIIDGYRKRYFENGTLQSVEKYDLGVQVDSVFQYHENGKLAQISLVNKYFNSDDYAAKYSKEFVISVFDSQGNQMINNGNGTWDQFFLNGNKRRSIEYKDGLPDGKWIIYSGQKNKKSCVMEFKKGVFMKGEIINGNNKEVFGTLRRKAFFRSGMRGLDKYITENTKGCREDGTKEIIAIIEIDSQGEVYFEQIISGAVTPCQLEEIQMLIKNMPDWIPAIRDGYFVESSQAIRLKY